MWVFLSDRRSIWWGLMVTLVASRIVNEVWSVMRMNHLRDRRSIWWGLMVTPVALRIVHEVSYVMRTQKVSLFVWQAQYLVRFDGDTSCSAHYESGFNCLCGLQWLCLLSLLDLAEMFLQVVCVCGWRLTNVPSCLNQPSWNVLDDLLMCSFAIRTCWKKRFFKMGIVETCHTHKFYRHLFFCIIYFFTFETSATASCGYMLYGILIFHLVL